MAEQKDKQQPKPDITLSDGTPVFFDKHNIKQKEWLALFDRNQPEEEGWDIMSRFAGLPTEYVSDLSVFDWQLLISGAVKKVQEPVSPNLPSESISAS